MKILRDAFCSALKDSDLLGKAEKARLETNWSTGEQVQGMVRELIDQPKPVFEIEKKCWRSSAQLLDNDIKCVTARPDPTFDPMSENN
ncbi:MAG TPA: hypothetical protein VF452_21540 [Candidatus Binatia bacterium]